MTSIHHTTHFSTGLPYPLHIIHSIFPCSFPLPDLYQHAAISSEGFPSSDQFHPNHPLHRDQPPSFPQAVCNWVVWAHSRGAMGGTYSSSSSFPKGGKGNEALHMSQG